MLNSVILHIPVKLQTVHRNSNFDFSPLSVLSERAARAMGPERESWRTCMKTSPPLEFPVNRVLKSVIFASFCLNLCAFFSSTHFKWVSHYRLVVLHTEETQRFKSDTVLAQVCFFIYFLLLVFLTPVSLSTVETSQALNVILIVSCLNCSTT